ncbi:MAG TPA: nucleoside kinase [Ktedonobacterales bacterium]|nr:nucleoside kinase [Ktedonobacterales bacterium]
MGRRNYLIDGVSGAGKTAVCTELQRRGYQAINGDDELAYQGDPDTGHPTDGLKHEHSATFISEHHIWDVEKVNAFVANQDEAVTFFCGGSKNSSKYIALFDGVFVLAVDLDTSLRRIEKRVALDPTDWGGTPEEREVTVRMYHTKAALPQNGTIIDATPPLARVVDEILRLSDANNTL